ncbi:YbfB/YjiJ family MFS transporter [Bartonella massiliensis]|uniref:YbfB/YjiJ family MFS transporter n=1 Tax=Bartonella massiliensis TaxID=929795 RepID=UPI002482C7CE|nr:YbfB/YjiJ family MFS transporter [Bartonella massiliensis]
MTSALIDAMAFITNFDLVILICFAVGIAGAAMMFGGLLHEIMQHNYNVAGMAWLYTGVGVGVLLGNEYVNIALGKSLNAQSILA